MRRLLASLVVTCGCALTFPQPALAASGLVGFRASGASAGGFRLRMLAVNDITGDGRDDALVIDAFGDLFVMVSGNDGILVQRPESYSTHTSSVPQIASADVNGDGLRDLFLDANIDVVLLGTATPGVFSETRDVYPRPTVDEGRVSVAPDFDRDGVLDTLDRDLIRFGGRGETQPVPRPPGLDPSFNRIQDSQVLDVDGDGFADVAVAYQDFDKFRVVFYRGLGVVVPPVVPEAPWAIAFPVSAAALVGLRALVRQRSKRSGLGCALAR